jgi:hypothetical protein
MIDPAVQNTLTEQGNDPASDFIQSMISALPGVGPVGKSRAAHRQWYESLSEEDQMKVRDKLREEIAKVREQFGRRSNAVSAQSVRLRDHG